MIKISSIYVSLLSECYRRHRKTVSYCQVHKIFLRSCIFLKPISKQIVVAIYVNMLIYTTILPSIVSFL